MGNVPSGVQTQTAKLVNRVSVLTHEFMIYFSQTQPVYCELLFKNLTLFWIRKSMFLELE